ncbi:MAG: DUF933 domain-containing protein [Desulfobacterales bacterium]|nr:DUF933 domain-containing protein [Desulfobacterales bacterium]
MKQQVYVCNADEDGVGKRRTPMPRRSRRSRGGGGRRGRRHLRQVRGRAGRDGQRGRQAASSWRELGLAESGALRAHPRRLPPARACVTFFTSGKDECRAWTIHPATRPRRRPASSTRDFEKGFIKAEVYSVRRHRRMETEAALKAARQDPHRRQGVRRPGRRRDVPQAQRVGGH